MTLIVMLEAVGVTVSDEAPGPVPSFMGLSPPPEQDPLVTVAVTLVPVSKAKPLGAFKMIVVPPPVTSPTAPSVMIDPVRAVNVPVPLLLFVSAEIAEPPVAAVTVADANAVPTGTKKPLMMNIAATNGTKRCFKC